MTAGVVPRSGPRLDGEKMRSQPDLRARAGSSSPKYRRCARALSRRRAGVLRPTSIEATDARPNSLTTISTPSVRCRAASSPRATVPLPAGFWASESSYSTLSTRAGMQCDYFRDNAIDEGRYKRRAERLAWERLGRAHGGDPGGRGALDP